MQEPASEQEPEMSSKTSRPRRWLWWIAALAVALTWAALSWAARPGSGSAEDENPTSGETSSPPSAMTGDEMSEAWSEIDRLIEDQKYQAALEQLQALRANFDANTDTATGADGDERLKALVRETQLRTALHGYEGTVLFLHESWQESAWPDADAARLLHRLLYAHSLRSYLGAYGWQVRQRERTTSADAALDPKHLDQWTADQIAEEVHRAFFEAWSLRQSWGDRNLGPLSRFLEQNSYPARIRGTLRDSLSHLWVGALEDRSLWTAAESNEVWRLDVGELLGTASEIDEAEELLQGPDVHPLRKIQVVLADLEAWHRDGERPEAAFDARRTLIAKLAVSFSNAEEKQRLKAALESALVRLGRDYPWWSMGQADLAEMTAASDDPWSLRDARDVAEAGRRAHADSPGGQRCAALVERWEAPQVSIQAMENDGAGSRSVLVRHANVGQIHWRAVPWDVNERLRTGEDRFDVRAQDLPELLARGPVASWRTNLPPTPDLRSHQTFVRPPLEDPGAYVLLADTDGDFGTQNDVVYFLEHRITELTMLVRTESDTLHAEVRSATDGEPLSGVDVEAWRLDWRQGHEMAARGRTGVGGELKLRLSQQGQYQIVARRGADSVHHQTWVGSRYEPPKRQRQSLVYTDRAIYRPGQEVQWKVVAYERNADLTWAEAQAGGEVTVQLIDANGEVVASDDVTTNDWGSASGIFEIPSGRALGSWSLTTDWQGHASVRIEEYKRPTFEVELLDPDESLRFGRDAELQGEARYYFGAPVTGGKVSWRVTRSPILPHWWHWRVRWWDPRPPQVLASGETEVQPDGTFRFTFTPEADPSLADDALGRMVAYAFRIEAEVVDPGGETREDGTTLQAGFVTVRASVSGPELVDAGEKLSFAVTRSNLEGGVSPGQGTWKLLRLVSPEQPALPAEVPVEAPASAGEESSEEPYRTEGDALHPRWSGGPVDLQSVLRRWDEGEAVASGSLRHDDKSMETVEWPEGLEAGAYALKYETRDADAADDIARVEADARFAVLAETNSNDAALAVPLLVTAESASVEVGDRAEVTVHSGWSDQDVVVEIWSGDERVRREVLTGGRPHRLELPVVAEHRGSLVFDVSLVRDHQLLRQQATVIVPWTDKKLDVELSSFRDLLRPGAEETWTVTVRDADGEPLDGLAGGRAAEVLASMYDRSLDLFARLSPPNAQSLWRSWTSAPGWATTVGQASGARAHGRRPRPRHGAPSFRDDRLIFFDGYPVGGPGARRGHVMMRSMAKQVPMPAPAAEPEADMMMMDEMSMEATETVSGLVENRSEAEWSDRSEDAGQGSADAPSTEGLRTDFSETAFWEPHLLLTDDGSVSFSFQVPDAVTEWRVWLRALTSDFRAGGFETTVRSAKELLVRPYLPRFFREGDRAELRVVVSNQGEESMSGTLDFDVIDPETETSRLADFGLAATDVSEVPFAIEPGAQTTLRFEVTAPKQPGQVAVRVLGRSESWSDGELRPLPVLPSRLYLSQSRFAVLDRPESRTLRFDDLLADDDPTRDDEALVMTLDGQLLTTVLNSLPYLVEYPYSCTEQSLNRFVSTGIVRSVFDDHPMVAELAKGLADERGTQFEAWDADDPNRKLLLEETPWLRQARGGEDGSNLELHKVLDPQIAGQVRDENLDRVLKSQTASGAFPWWPGGPPSPYMTLYVLDSFARAREFGVEVPQQPVVRAWSYLNQHYRTEFRDRLGEESFCCLPLVVYLRWMLSNYPDPSWTGDAFTEADRERMLKLGFTHWRQLSPRLKGYLALTLAREDRLDDAKLVWDSVMDSAKTDEDLGTYWAPEKLAWLWYNDTIETHAFAIRVLSELDAGDDRLSGLVQWLLVQKKLNHWKSTRATAEVIYSLVGYLKTQDLLGIREAATVRVGDRTRDFVFAGEDATAADRRQQWVIDGDEVTPAMGEIEVSKETRGFLLASATWHFATDRLPETAEGDLFQVHRRYYRRVLQGDEWTLEPIAEGARVEVGDQLEVQLDVTAGHAAEYVHLRDPRGAGFEPEDPTSGYRWDGLGHYREIRDSATNFFFEWLPAGQYTLKYRVRAATAGTFRVGPAQLQSMYAPEFVAYSTGAELSVDGGE